MKICLISARFPPDHCGIGDYTYFLGKALSQLGYNVDVLTSVGQLDPVLYPLCGNLEVHRLVKGWGFRGLWALFQACWRLRPDVFIVQYGPHAFNPRGITFAVNLVPLLLRAMTRTRVVTNFHELYIPFAVSLKRSAIALWQRAMAFVIAYGSHRLMATASDWPRRLKRIGVLRNIRVIPVGSNILRVEVGLEERMRIRRQLLGEQDGFLLAGFGALRDRDIESIMVALERARAEKPSALVWIGAGGVDVTNRVQLDAQMKERGLEKDWIWTGLLPSPEVSKYLSACDVTVLPFIGGISTRRGSAMAALQHGLPLLSTHDGQVDSCFMHGQNLYLVPVRDREALVQGLLDLASSPDLRARLGQGALALHEGHFRWDVIAREVIQAVVEEVEVRGPSWSWGSKVTDQLRQDGLSSVKDRFEGNLLDLGCGTKPYKSLFGERVRRWIGLDFEVTPSGRSEADVFGSALALPFKADFFDTILCTQVLEHVPQPDHLLGEAFRVLKPGGSLVLTAPQTNPLHEEPHDYFRYTSYGLRYLAERAGFSVLEVKPLGGAIAAVGQMLIWHLNWLRKVPVIGMVMSKSVTAFLAWITLKLDRLSPLYGGGAIRDTLNWLLVSRKPGGC